MKSLSDALLFLLFAFLVWEGLQWLILNWK
jgi:hypothetical protein